MTKKKKTGFISVLVVLMTMLITTSVSASESIQEIEKRYSNDIGIPINLVDVTESNTIIESIKTFFKPSTSTEYLINVSEIVYKELLKYNKQVLQEKKISVYIVEPNNQMAAGLANVTSSECKLYISDNERWTRDTLTRTVHHEIFHCFDKSEDIRHWGEKYTMSDYVSKGWKQFETNGNVSVVQSGEERAEYFAAGMTSSYTLFDGTHHTYKADLQFEQKKQAMKQYINYFSKQEEVKEMENPIETGVVKKWENGRITSIKVYQDYEIDLEYEFDYANSVYTVKEQGEVKTVEML